MDINSYLVPGKRVHLAGIGGVSMSPLAEVLHSMGLSVQGSDMNDSPAVEHLRALGIPVAIGHAADNLGDADFVVRTAAIHDDNPEISGAVARGIPVFERAQAWGAIMHGYRNALCISGTHGKTTTTTLISEMLKAEGKTVWLGGNIGTPLLPLTRQMKETDLAVVELSSFQLMDMKRSPQRAVVTNLAPNHLDIHKDMQEYVDAKKNIFRYQDGSGLLVLNADNDITAAFRGNGTTRFFSRKGMAYVCIEDGVICRNGEPILPTKDILIPGVHNIENYMAAITVVEGLVSDETIRHVAKTFGGVEHRIELVRVKDGVRFYNDSIASSPSRTIAGLRSFPEKVILIAGGYDKHIPYDVLGPEICAHVKKLFLGGATGPKIREAVESCPEYDPNTLKIVDCGSFEPAVRAAAAAAKPGDVVLMSPASAAFDQFKNFMVRGAFFKKLVKEL